jgi:hypothetical protein
MKDNKICGACESETESQSDFCNIECYQVYYNKIKEWHNSKNKQNEQ